MAKTPNLPNPAKGTAENPEDLILVTIRGSYFSKEPVNGNREKPYKVTIKLTVAEVADNPVAVFRNGFENYMRMKYPDFEAFATHELVSTIPANGRPVNDLNLLNRNDLIILINRENLLKPINTKLYPTADDLRQAIYDILEDESGFRHTQKIKLQMADPLKAKGLHAEQRNMPDAIEYAEANAEATDLPSYEIAPLHDLIRTKEANRKVVAESQIPDIDQIGNLKDEDDAQRVQAVINAGGSVVRDQISKDDFSGSSRPTRGGKPLTNLGV